MPHTPEHQFSLQSPEMEDFFNGALGRMFEDAIDAAIQTEIRERVDIVARDLVSRRFANINSPEAFIGASAELASARSVEAVASPENTVPNAMDSALFGQLSKILDRRLESHLVFGPSSETVISAETMPVARVRSAELLAAVSARSSEALAARMNSHDMPPPAHSGVDGLGGFSKELRGLVANGKNSEALRLVMERGLSGLDEVTLSVLEGVEAKAKVAEGKAEVE